MKYAVLLFDDPAAWETSTESELGALHAQYMAVTEQTESYGGAQLRPAETAKTLRLANGEPVVTDGPFTESKEILSGFYLVDADSEARALEIALDDPHRLPHGRSVEIRPLVER